MIRRFDKVIRKGKNNEPPIKGFVLAGVQTNVDSTQFVLEAPYAVILFCEKFSSAGIGWKSKFEKVYQEAKAKNIPAYVVTAQPTEALEAIKSTSFASIQVFKCDFKAIQTASRSELSVYLLKQGTVQAKASIKKMNTISRELSNIR
jgi:hypothetical protein